MPLPFLVAAFSFRQTRQLKFTGKINDAILKPPFIK
jgi:hypothetical protein